MALTIATAFPLEQVSSLAVNELITGTGFTITLTESISLQPQILLTITV